MYNDVLGRCGYRKLVHNFTLEKGEHLMRMHGSALQHKVALMKRNIWSVLLHM